MSLGIINKNTSSPFMLRRSIVDQGGKGGAYEQGGFDPEATYSDGGAAEAIASFGRVMGAAISSRTAGDDNEKDISTSNRLQKKSKRIADKISDPNSSEDKVKRSDRRLGNIGEKQRKVESRIKEYNEFIKPTLLSNFR